MAEFKKGGRSVASAAERQRDGGTGTEVGV